MCPARSWASFFYFMKTHNTKYIFWIFLFSIHLTINCFAQNTTFSTSFDVFAGDSFWSIETDSTGITVVNDHFCDNTITLESDCTTFIRTDFEGNLLWQKTNEKMLLYNNGALNHTKDGGYIGVGHYIINDSIDYIGIQLARFDKNGDTLDSI